MTGEPVRVSPGWLELREEADAAARSEELVGRVRSMVGPRGRLLVHDLGCGTGSMGRWLAPRLTGPQHWVLYDRDPELLAHAERLMPGAAADGAPVTIETRCRDITRLDPAEVAGASLVTASALLDMLTAPELERFVATCVAARCPVLVTLSVTGRVELTPPDAVDGALGAAFNAHQRRTVGGRWLLGPDAVAVAAELFRNSGAEVLVRPSPWRLRAQHAALAAEWAVGWVKAACEQEQGLAAAAAEYLERRLAQAMDGVLLVTVHHDDLLAVPR